VLRRFLIALLLTAVTGAAALAGFAVAARLGPERLRAALQDRLARELGPTTVGSVRPFFGWGLGVELADVRAGNGGAGSLAAERIWITLSPHRALRGELRPRRIDVRGLRLEARQGADGAWQPAALERLLARSAPAAGDTTPSLRSRASALPSISVEDAELRVARAGGPALVARHARIALSHDPLGGAPRVRAAGRLGEPGASGGFELVAALEDDGPRGDLAITDADLGALAPWLGDVGIAGRASGVASWAPEGALAFEVIATGLRAARKGGPPLALASGLARGRLEIEPRRLRLAALEASAEGSTVTGRASIERPIRDASRISFELSGGPLPVPVLRDALLAARPDDEAWRRNVGALRAGVIEAFALRGGEQSVAAYRALDRSGLLAPEQLSLEATLSSVELAVGRAEPIRELSGRFSLSGDRLRIENTTARYGARKLPLLDLSVHGLEAVRVALERGTTPRPVPPLPGVSALDRWIDSKRRPGSPPRWRRIDVDADFIEHPLLLRPLEQVQAVLAPSNPGVRVESAKGYWGGVAFQGKGGFRGGANSRLDADVTLSLPRRAGRRRSDAEAWGRAKLRWDLEKLGDFQAESLEAVAQAIGDRIELRRGEAKLHPRGELRGTVDLDLSRGDRVPYRARIELANGSLSDLMNDLRLDGGLARGTADGDLDATGELIVEHRSMLEDLRGNASLRLRDGEINKRMNVLFAIAQVSDTLNPFRSIETIPYERIDAPFALAGGFATTEAFALHGPALRMVGSGRIDLVRPPFAIEAVIGIFYFRTLDRVIGVFPILNRMLLGPDDNLLSTYFAVSGPWGDPDARLIPVKSIASGPASFVLEGLPAFVRGGLSAIERVLTPKEPAGRAGGDVSPAPPPPGGAAAPTPTTGVAP
jgi:hypothetical protein